MKRNNIFYLPDIILFYYSMNKYKRIKNIFILCLFSSSSSFTTNKMKELKQIDKMKVKEKNTHFSKRKKKWKGKIKKNKSKLFKNFSKISIFISYSEGIFNKIYIICI